jgi:hypothetical protein
MTRPPTNGDGVENWWNANGAVKRKFFPADPTLSTAGLNSGLCSEKLVNIQRVSMFPTITVHSLFNHCDVFKLSLYLT